MKIFAFADIHANVVAMKKVTNRVEKEKVDVVLFAGDISMFGQGAEKILKELLRLKIPVFLVHGNHDSEDELQTLCKENLQFIHGKIIRLDNYLLVGWGGGGFSSVDREFERFVRQNKRLLIKEKIIFITHGPPYKTKLDKIGNYYVGNKSYTDFIKKYDVVLAVSGHIHETGGAKDKIKQAMLVNPGPFGEVVNI